MKTALRLLYLLNNLKVLQIVINLCLDNQYNNKSIGIAIHLGIISIIDEMISNIRFIYFFFVIF